MSALHRLLNPRSIAMVGGTPAETAIAQCDRLGFDGDIWPIHPTRDTIGGRPAYRSISDLPGAPDAALVAVNREASIDVMRQLADIGCGGAVAYASGYAEVGADGAQFQTRLVDGHSMPIMGPNCYGFINARSGACLWPDQQGLTRCDSGAAIVTQSGNIGVNITMNGRGLDITHLITLGNQASVTVADCVAALAADPAISAIGLHIEALKDPRGFAEAAAVAHANHTPVVALKTGITDTAATITASHTAALSSPAAVYEAFFSRCGVVTVHSVPDLLTTLRVLTTIGPLPGNRVVSLSCSGGEAALVADRSQHHALEFAPFSPSQRGRIAATLNNFVAITNPMDYHTFIWGDEEALAACFTEVLTGPADAAMLVLDWPSQDLDDTTWWPTLRGVQRATGASSTPVIVTASLPECMPDRIRDELATAGIPAGFGIDETLTALAAAATVGRVLSAPMPPPALAVDRAVGDIELLGEPASKDLLDSIGIDVPAGVVVANPAASVPLPPPYAVKAVGLAHKTEQGGVRIGVEPDALAETVAEMLTIGDRALVETMADQPIAELLLSARREPPIGIALTLGSGGVRAEIERDTATVLLPLTDGDVEGLVDRLRIAPILRGFRGAPAISMTALADTIDRLCHLIASDPSIVEVEINPLFAGADRCVAVDAVVARRG